MRYQLSSHPAQRHAADPLHVPRARPAKPSRTSASSRWKPTARRSRPTARPCQGVPNGVKISFTGDEGKAQTLYYFSTDVSNGGVKSSGFLKFCEKLGTGDAFIKSASYLMHSDSFSTVREFLLDHTAALVQDDTGVPVRFFKNEDWELRPYGRYLGPIGLFSGRYQSKLSELFRKGHSTAIDFGVGYRWRPNESNLLLATRQQKRADRRCVSSRRTAGLSLRRRDEVEVAAQDGVEPAGAPAGAGDLAHQG